MGYFFYTSVQNENCIPHQHSNCRYRLLLFSPFDRRSIYSKARFWRVPLPVGLNLFRYGSQHDRETWVTCIRYDRNTNRGCCGVVQKKNCYSGRLRVDNNRLKFSLSPIQQTLPWLFYPSKNNSFYVYQAQPCHKARLKNRQKYLRHLLIALI